MGQESGIVYSVVYIQKYLGRLSLKHYQETFGEDPWLSGHLTTAYVTGLQGGIELAKS